MAATVALLLNLHTTLLAPPPTPAPTVPTTTTTTTAPPPPPLDQLLSAPAWVQEEFTCIRWAESRDNPTIVNPSGTDAAGLYQFEPATWQANGGLQFASVAQDATPWQQDDVALWTWEKNGFSPWAGDPCVG